MLGKIAATSISHDRPAVVWSFVVLFLLLCSYYILRPVRDEMGVRACVQNLQWLFSVTFVVMLAAIPVYGYVTGRWRRSRVLRSLCLFLAAVFVGFFTKCSQRLLSPCITTVFRISTPR